MTTFAKTSRRLLAVVIVITVTSLNPWNLLANGQQIDGLETEITRVEQELSDLRARYKEAHPSVISAKRHLEALRQMLHSGAGITDQSSPEFSSLHLRLQALLREYTEAHPDVIALRQMIEKQERFVPPRNDIPKALAQRASETIRPRTQSQKLKPEKRPEIGKINENVPNKSAPFYVNGRMRLPITVKEVAGVGATQHPTTVVIPLPYGRYKDVSDFRMTDSDDEDIAAQIDVLDRWWARDRSIRHLKVAFQPTVSAHVAHREASGTTTYFLSDDGPANPTKNALQVNDAPDYVDVITGPLRFTVSKRAFAILNSVWLDENKDGVFDDDERILDSNGTSGSILLGRTDDQLRYDSARRNTKVTIEESGPLRVVIKAEALTRYLGPDDHTHGFAVRVYAFAGKPYVKIDFQLQNSDKQPVYAGPLYFQSLALEFPLRLTGEPSVRVGTGAEKVYQNGRGEGLLLAQESHDAFSVRKDAKSEPLISGQQASGFLDVRDRTRGVAAFLRFFWETWPNGLQVTPTNALSIQPFPRLGSQWNRNEVHPTGLYWLQDMQHVYKEALLVFHRADLSDDELHRTAMRFDSPPVATLPANWYIQTRVTLDLGGAVPKEDIALTNQRAYEYAQKGYDSGAPKHYRFGWKNFYLADPVRKKRPAIAGGWAYGRAQYVLSEDPADVALLELLTIGELNTRPHWLAGYRYADDFERIKLGTRLPWQAASWRKGGKLGDPYLPGTQPDARPRDDAHGWYHHVRESYYATANPWIKDWFSFIGEHRKAFLAKHHNLASRAIGHALASAIDAFRVTGDLEILDLAHRHIVDRLRKQQDPYFGFRNSRCCGKFGEAAFQAGFLARAVINFMEEVEVTSQAYADAFQFLSGLMEWNLHFSNFSYYLDPRKGETGKSHGSGLTLVDPQAWYYWHTGKRDYWDQIEDYLQGGIDEGRGPFGRFKSWKGQYEGRLYRWVTERNRVDAAPPAPIQDLEAPRAGDGTLLRFTRPLDAVRYHIVWGDKPIVEGPSSDPAELNWWKAGALSASAKTTPGTKERLRVPADAKYLAVLSFDAANNMSALSNVAASTDLLRQATDHRGRQWQLHDWEQGTGTFPPPSDPAQYDAWLETVNRPYPKNLGEREAWYRWKNGEDWDGPEGTGGRFGKLIYSPGKWAHEDVVRIKDGKLAGPKLAGRKRNKTYGMDTMQVDVFAAGGARITAIYATGRFGVFHVDPETKEVTSAGVVVPDQVKSGIDDNIGSPQVYLLPEHFPSEILRDGLDDKARLYISGAGGHHRRVDPVTGRLFFAQGQGSSYDRPYVLRYVEKLLPYDEDGQVVLLPAVLDYEDMYKQVPGPNGGVLQPVIEGGKRARPRLAVRTTPVTFKGYLGAGFSTHNGRSLVLQKDGGVCGAVDGWNSKAPFEHAKCLDPDSGESRVEIPNGGQLRTGMFTLGLTHAAVTGRYDNWMYLVYHDGSGGGPMQLKRIQMKTGKIEWLYDSATYWRDTYAGSKDWRAVAHSAHRKVFVQYGWDGPADAFNLAATSTSSLSQCPRTGAIYSTGWDGAGTRRYHDGFHTTLSLGSRPEKTWEQEYVWEWHRNSIPPGIAPNGDLYISNSYHRREYNHLLDDPDGPLALRIIRIYRTDWPKQQPVNGYANRFLSPQKRKELMLSYVKRYIANYDRLSQIY